MHVIRGAIAGTLAGLAAAWIMSLFQQRWSERQGGERTPAGETATAKAAERTLGPVLDRPLTRAEKMVAGPAVHYGMGAAMGALYGAASEIVPGLRTAGGLPYGAAVWLVADELAVPAAGLAEPPPEAPAATHVYALASHLVYGASLEIARRIVKTVV